MNFGNSCRSVMALDLIVRVCHTVLPQTVATEYANQERIAKPACSTALAGQRASLPVAFVAEMEYWKIENATEARVAGIPSAVSGPT